MNESPKTAQFEKIKSWASTHPILGWPIAVAILLVLAKGFWESIDFFSEKYNKINTPPHISIESEKLTTATKLAENSTPPQQNNKPRPTTSENTPSKPQPAGGSLAQEQPKKVPTPKEVNLVKPSTPSKIPPKDQVPTASGNLRDITTDTEQKSIPITENFNIESSKELSRAIKATDLAENSKTPSIRPQTKSIISALKGQTGSSRVESIRIALPSIPSALNAAEISALLGNETGSSRLQALKILLSKTTENSLDASSAADIFGTEVGSTLASMIEETSTFIRRPISGLQANKMLKNAVGSTRANSIKSIAPLLESPLTEESVDLILGNLVGSSRTEATGHIFSK